MAYLQGAICDFHYARETPASLWQGTLQTRLTGTAWYPLYTESSLDQIPYTSNLDLVHAPLAHLGVGGRLSRLCS